MVRTRHSGEGDCESSPKFLSLRNERNRHAAKSPEDIDGDQHPPLSYRGKRHAYNVYEGEGEEKVESRSLRPRVGPSHAYNYLDADSSDDDSYRRKRRQEPMPEMMDRRQRSRYREHQMKREILEERHDRSERRLRRKMAAPVEERQEHSVTEDDDEHVETMRRRSSRARRPVYDTLNQSYLVGQKKSRDTHMDVSELKDQEDQDDQDTDENQAEFSDMYSRVKRKRIHIKRNMYGVPIDEDSDADSDADSEHEGTKRLRNRNNNSKDDDEEEESEGHDDEEEDENENDGEIMIRRSKRRTLKKEPKEAPAKKQYSLREHKPKTDRYNAPIEEPRIRRTDHSVFQTTPTKKSTTNTYQSPAQRRNKSRSRKRHAFHGDSDSTSSSSDSESDDEKKFKHRKAKSIAKSRNRMMPMNFTNDSMTPGGVIKDRVKSGTSLADVEPMNINTDVTFDSIGGLGKHVNALKEMVLFPLLYDKYFQRFKIDPPRGVLFYGPPGTGKTLVARALANECSKLGRKVAFFMRKGADCLSKWVGESERQLRILFDQAYKFRPSIIFFDEIDGIAPVRSSRQDQIHSSIVSTLLALMDGLDSRGEIVVIGATNRIDSLDPALRRPGRFDREFLFSLPSLEARKQILKIHTNAWNPRLNDNFISELAEKCVGYCGADLKALCTEAVMLALRRRYPQIYFTSDALQIDENSVKVSARDFFDAAHNIIPTSQRSVNTPARALTMRVCPLLQRQLDRVMTQLSDIFPPCLSQTSSVDAAENGEIWEDMASDEEEDAMPIFVSPHSHKGSKAVRKHLGEGTSKQENPTYLNFASCASSRPATFKPRMLLAGVEGQGQTTYIGPAVVHKMENLPLQVLDLPTLYAVTAKTPEESCSTVFHEVKRKTPSILYLPYINQWWDVMADTLKATLLSHIHNLDPNLAVLILVTSEQPYHQLDPTLQSLFNKNAGEVVTMTNPNRDERKVFFQDLLVRQACRPPTQKKLAGEILKPVQNSKIAKSGLSLSKNGKGLKRKHASPFGKEMCKASRCSKDSKQKLTIAKVVTAVSHQPCPYKRQFNEKFRVRNLIANHRMYLRSQAINTNQSAKSWSSLDHTMRSHGATLRSTCVPTFAVPKAAAYEAASTVHRSMNLSDRHARYLRRICKLENKLATVGSSHTQDCFDPQCRDSHCSLTNRHQCYVRRLEKLGHPSDWTMDAAEDEEMASSISSVFSCGSFAMLYKDAASRKGTKSTRSDLPLPINLREVCEDRQFSAPHLIQNQLNTSAKICKAASIKSRVFHRHPRYNLRLRSRKKQSAQRMLEVLPKAAPAKPRELSKEELKSLHEKEELTLMELRIFLRDVLNKLGGDKKFSIFAKPVDIDDAPDYYEVIEQPMDLTTMMSKIDLHEYHTVSAFMKDIDLVCSNALEYNPNRGHMDRIIRHRACFLKDTAYAIIKTELDKDFEKMCVEIEESRKRRGQKTSDVPNFYYTKPLTQTTTQANQARAQNGLPSYLEIPKAVRSIPTKPDGERFSRRVRGINIDPVQPLETVEKVYSAARTGSPVKGTPNNSSGGADTQSQSTAPLRSETDTTSVRHTEPKRSVVRPPATKSFSTGKLGAVNSLNKSLTDTVSSKKKKVSKCVWCRPKRKRARLTFSRNTPKQNSVDDEDTEMEVSQGEEEEPSITDTPQATTEPTATQLSIDVSEVHSETQDLKSPPTRSSGRLRSPALTSPVGVSTRRSSMSPRGSATPAASTAPLNASAQNVIVEEEKMDTQSSSTSVFETACTSTNMTSNTTEALLSSAQNKTSQDSGVQSVSLSSTFDAKSSVVKRLDLDPVTMDSGVGSSLDSNGDSRDSLEHSVKEAISKPTEVKDTDVNQNCTDELKTQATALLNESTKELVVDKARLESLLLLLVGRTEGFNVERLEEIYNHLSQVIYRHRKDYNKTAMIVNLEKKVEEMTKLVPSTSSLGHSSGAYC